MAPKRRSGGISSTPTTRTQSTLSFNNKSRVTKPTSSLPPSKDKKGIVSEDTTTSSNNKKPRLSDQAKSDIESQISEHEKPDVTEIEVEDEAQPEAAIQQKAEEEQEEEVEEQATTTTPPPKSRRKSRKPTSDYDIKLATANKISDAKIKAYWKAEEDGRLAPRVHQQSLPVNEKILRHFDLSSQYGPCIGIPRLERWKRASTLGLDPPIEVLAVLVREEKKGADKGVGGRQCGKLAYIDELAGGRVVLVE